MTTKQIEPDLDARHEKQRHRRSRNVTTRFGVLAAAAALGLAAVACSSGLGDDQDAPPPADEPSVAPVDTTAMEVATGFLEAFGAFDVSQAMTYLADDAVIASMGAADDPRLLISYLEATGYEQTLEPCEEVGDSASGTSVRCPFDFHALRSGEIGKGPFSGGAFDLVVRDGEIVEVSQGWEIEEFSPQVWEPFAEWVSTTHPKDAAVMYTDESLTGVQLTEESIRLWGQRTQEYVADLAG